MRGESSSVEAAGAASKCLAWRAPWLSSGPQRRLAVFFFVLCSDCDDADVPRAGAPNGVVVAGAPRPPNGFAAGAA
eukprot:CAMPEP_0185513842 /NCGR_PEP_ID=MMETSP1366-20130426/57750_1 /TAXON_ID=38817 /ORGANISM="Gephyrocapsa oceanica, Strain RCC1303" /LENGTH=75 /DNA_ID=CAMNT_0028124575 /DNA_START=75 /DNA_END=299 /DNA_ORIENTATION=-